MAVVLAGSFVLASYVLQPQQNNAAYNDAQRAALIQALRDWTPVATNGASVALMSSEFSISQMGCSRIGDRWTGANDEFKVSLAVTQCESSYRAYDLVDNFAGDVVPLHVADGTYNALRVHEERHRAQAVWRFRGTVLALGVECGDSLDCRAQLEPLVSNIGSALREVGLPLADPKPDSGGAILLAPVAAWLIAVMPWRLVQRVRRRRWVSADGVRYRDLSRQLGRAAWVRAARNLLRIPGWPAAVLGALGCLAAIIDRDGTPLVISVVVGGFGAAALVGARLLSSAAEDSVAPVKATGLGSAVGAFLSATATATAVWIIVVYSLIGLMVRFGQGQDMFLAAAVDPQSAPLGFASQVVGFTVLGLQEDASLLYVLVILPALGVALIVSSVGQRLQAADVATAVRADHRAPILYLRAFEEDSLRVRASTLRRSLSQRLLARRTRRFEEVLAGALARYGPVTAISPPGARLASLGAAKANLPHDQWHQAVRDMVDHALVVVVSGTPPEVRPGLAWELGVLGADPQVRLMVVQAPWRPRKLQRNWSVFCGAVARYPVLVPLTYSWVQPGTQVLAHRADQGWFAWGANARTDRSYALAVDEAFRWAGGSWEAGLAASRASRELA